MPSVVGEITKGASFDVLVEGDSVGSSGPATDGHVLTAVGDGTAAWESVPAHTHASTTGQTTDDHHAKLHAADHVDGTDDIQSATAAQKGVATAAQITKLDGIETAADVTDATNVTAAGAVMASTVDAKGDIYAATADNAVTRLAVGTNDQVLTADSAEATGVKWAAAGGGVSAHGDLTGVTSDQHHAQSHTVDSHSDTTATGAELETLTDGSDAGALHTHTLTNARVLFAQEPNSADDFIVWFCPVDITITKVWGQTDVGTVDLQLVWRTVTSPASGGTNILSATLVASSTGANTTSFADATIPAESWIVYKASATASSPTTLHLAMKYTQVIS